MNYSIEAARAALSFISPNVSRYDWIRVGAAIKSEFGEAGFAYFDEWSADGDKYNQKECRNTWDRHIKPTGGVNFATLIWMAKENGFDPKSIEHHEISEEEQARQKQERAERERLAEADLKQRRGDAAALAVKIWDDAKPADNHPYLARKQIRGHGLRIGRVPVGGDEKLCLLVPLINKSGKIRSLQSIQSNGFKSYLKDGEKQGCFHVIQPIAGKDDVIICEGMATAESLHAATGCRVYAAMDAGNLKNIAKTVRGFHASSAIIIAADNDQFSEKNAGVIAANEAAAACGGRVVVPEFKDLSSKPTDFNDLHALEGLDAVALQIYPQAEIIEPAPALTQSVEVNQREKRMFINYNAPLIDTNDKGRPFSTIENLGEICRLLGIRVRYDVIKKEEDILIPGESFSLDNKGNASLARLKSECAKFRMPVSDIGLFITYLADQDLFNPVETWINSRAWDGQSRLNEFLNTVTPQEYIKLSSGEFLHHVLIRKWMISAVNAALNPAGGSSRGVLVFQGEQLIGKTYWFKRLTPKELDLYQEGVILDTGDKDSVLQTLQHWIVELGEIDATFKKSDNAALKAFITREKDVIRRAYAPVKSVFARRTVFFASVNPKTYLHDSTGNTRYWTVPVKSLDLKHDIDMQQVWAEIYELWRAGESHFLDEETNAAMSASNEQHSSIEPIEELLQDRLLWNMPDSQWEWKTATRIAQEIGLQNIKKSDTNAVSQYVRKMNGNRDKRSSGQRLLLAPKPKESYYRV